MQNEKITGILKQNESSNPKAPHFKGFVKINGVHYWISAWWNGNGNGKPGAKLEHEPHYQLVFEEEKEKEEVPQPHHVGGQPFERKPYMGIEAKDGPKVSELVDDIPF
jgi:hypothetical protein